MWCQSPEVTACSECHCLRSMGCSSSGPASDWAPVVGWLPWRGPWSLSGLQKVPGHSVGCRRSWAEQAPAEYHSHVPRLPCLALPPASLSHHHSSLKQ